jgi:hypothetical protein
MFEAEEKPKKTFFSMLRNTQWSLDGLATRTDLNGRMVTVIEDYDANSDRIRITTMSNETLRVRPDRLISLNDSQVTARIVLSAITHIQHNPDANLTSFIGRWQQGDHDGALSAAATFTLNAIKRPSDAPTP